MKNKKKIINVHHWAALILSHKTRDNDEQKIAAQYRQGAWYHLFTEDQQSDIEIL